MNKSTHTLTTCKTRAKEILRASLGFAPQLKNFVITYCDDNRLEFTIADKGYSVVSTYGIGNYNYAVYMYTEIESDGNFKERKNNSSFK